MLKNNRLNQRHVNRSADYDGTNPGGVRLRTRQFHDHENESRPIFNAARRGSFGQQLCGGEYKSELSEADIIIASTHVADEIVVSGNKYVVGVRNMLSAADFGPKLMEVIGAHFPQDLKQ